MYRLKHIPTGLYYGPKRYRQGHLTRVGKIYHKPIKIPAYIAIPYSRIRIKQPPIPQILLDYFKPDISTVGGNEIIIRVDPSEFQLINEKDNQDKDWLGHLKPIISEYRGGSNEPLDGDDVDRLCEIIKAKINFNEGNITCTEYDKILNREYKINQN